MTAAETATPAAATNANTRIVTGLARMERCRRNIDESYEETELCERQEVERVDYRLSDTLWTMEGKESRMTMNEL